LHPKSWVAFVVLMSALAGGIIYGKCRYSHNSKSMTMRKIQILHRACFVYKKELRRLPDPAQWQVQLMLADRSGFTGPGIVYFVDSWGHPIRYRVPGSRSGIEFDLYSMGENGIDEGGGGDDLGNWDGSWRRYDGVWQDIRKSYVADDP